VNRRPKLPPKPKRKPRRKARTPTPRSQPAPPAPATASDADPLADARIRPLLERYCRLARATMTSVGTDHYELTLPRSERGFFRDRESLRVAFSLDALARDPEAEIVVLGSPLLSQLLDAIRGRAARFSLGAIGSTTPVSSGPLGVELPIPVRDGRAQLGATQSAVHPVGRLIARVVLRAGAAVEETVVESDVYDLSAGAPLADDLAGLFQDLEARRTDPADPSAGAAAVPPLEPQDLIRLLLGNLREKSAERVAVRRAAAGLELTDGLARLDRYFAAILQEQSDPEAVATVTALAERRRAEEVRRSQVRVTVHPLQLIEATALIERAEWQLEAGGGHRATFSAQRSSRGEGGWILTCPYCGTPPATLVVCKHDHCACEACSYRCAVCQEDFCAAHGIAQCRVDGQPACTEHVRTCPSCRLEHCTAHEGVCAEGDHGACSACLAPCGSCGRTVCNRHAEQSSADAPKGRRRLCAACLRYCEGGSNEPVGMDEVTQCASCDQSVCTAHRAECAVDGQVHCSRHLRRADTSRRLVCGRHWAGCAYEPATLFASDEVAACASCGNLVCAGHSAECVVDHERHCVTHLAPLLDANGAYACATHRKECHVDGEAFSLGGVSECPVCRKGACARHRAACGYCGRLVCTTDLGPTESDGRLRRCSTCAQLAVAADAPDAVVAAARAASGGAPQSSRSWRIARDLSHSVVELDLGLSRKTVVAVRHEDLMPDSVVKHSLLGSKRRT
jgi:hypothetical protein